MKARAQRDRWPRHAEYVPAPWPATVRESTTGLSPDDLTAGAFVLGLVVRDATHTVTRNNDGTTTAWVYSLTEGDRSWAAVSWGTGAGPGRVCQHGERKLWTEVENGLDWWTGEERPPADCFGLTVDATDGEHTHWLDGPHDPVPHK